MANKAHTATIRRICERYGGVSGEAQGIDIIGETMLVEVETTATLEEGVARLLELPGLRYVAVTNKEAVAEAIQLTAKTGIGVMDPHGNIVRAARDGVTGG